MNNPTSPYSPCGPIEITKYVEKSMTIEDAKEFISCAMPEDLAAILPDFSNNLDMCEDYYRDEDNHKNADDCKMARILIDRAFRLINGLL